MSLNGVSMPMIALLPKDSRITPSKGFSMEAPVQACLPEPKPEPKPEPIQAPDAPEMYAGMLVVLVHVSPISGPVSLQKLPAVFLVPIHGIDRQRCGDKLSQIEQNRLLEVADERRLPLLVAAMEDEVAISIGVVVVSQVTQRDTQHLACRFDGVLGRVGVHRADDCFRRRRLLCKDVKHDGFPK
jgi:hypothetical protein